MAVGRGIEQVFEVQGGVCLMSTSPESLESILARLATAGTLSLHVRETCKKLLSGWPPGSATVQAVASSALAVMASLDAVIDRMSRGEGSSSSLLGLEAAMSERLPGLEVLSLIMSIAGGKGGAKGGPEGEDCASMRTCVLLDSLYSMVYKASVMGDSEK